MVDLYENCGSCENFKAVSVSENETSQQGRIPPFIGLCRLYGFTTISIWFPPKWCKHYKPWNELVPLQRAKTKEELNNNANRRLSHDGFEN